MMIRPLRTPARWVEQLFHSGSVAGFDERQLLDRFVARRDEAAFEALVAQHAPMVLRVCGRLLRDSNDVEDAFQATFLVLARKASQLRDRDLLGNWLYGVALRVALRSRAVAAKRSAREILVDDELPALEDNEPKCEQQVCLHEEIARLPEKYRSLIVLCYLEGFTHDAAAARLGCPVGTVKGRLARARDLLRDRLVRRGLTTASAALLAELPRDASAAVPPILLDATVRGATALTAGQIGAVSGSVMTLMEGVLATMSVFKLKSIPVALCVASGIVAACAAVYAYQDSGGDERQAGGAPAIDPPASKKQGPDFFKVARKPATTSDRNGGGSGGGPQVGSSMMPGSMIPGATPPDANPLAVPQWPQPGPHQAAEIRHRITVFSARLAASNRSKANAAILSKLDEPLHMSFPSETPFEDVLKYIKQATQGPNDSGIPVYIDPVGLAQAEKTMTSPIVLDLDGVPLKTTLRLLLKQIGLAYCVKDRLVIISSPEGILEELMDAEETPSSDAH